MKPDELFPGFNTPPNDPSKNPRPAFTVTPENPRYMDDGYDDEMDEEPCAKCDGWGYIDCFCGGDFCICSNNGEEPCWNCV